MGVSELFVYRPAQAVLDAWCLSDARPVGFRRAYLKLMVAVLTVAQVDYSDGKMTEESIASAWEELQMACTGQGEAGIQGFLFQLWSYCREEEKESLRRVFEIAFDVAERRTSSTAPRLYLKKQRTMSFDALSDTPCVRQCRAPYRGARLRDVLVEDPRIHDKIEQAMAYMASLEATDREVPSLRLVPSSDDSDV